MFGTLKMLAVAGAIGATTLATQPAQAEVHGGFNIGIGFNVPVRTATYIAPPPVYFQQTFVAPAAYYQPAPVYAAQPYYYQPTYYAPSVYQPTYYTPAYCPPAPVVYYPQPVYYSQPALSFGVIGFRGGVDIGFHGGGFHGGGDFHGGGFHR